MPKCILLLALCVPLIFCRDCHSEASPQIKVGAILALTGPLSVQGVPFKNAMILATEELDPQHRVALSFEDDAFLPRQTLSAAQKFIEQDHIDVLIVFGTNQGLAVVDKTESKKIPFLSININRAVVKDRHYAVLLMPPLEKLTAQNIEEAKRRGYTRVATVATIQDSCLLQKDLFEKAGVAQIVSSQEMDPAEREFREVASRIVSSRPDAVFLSTLPPQGSLLAKRLRAIGFKGEFFGGIQLAYLSELQASEGALTGAWVVSGDDRNAEAYYARYKARFGSEPTDLSMYAYDSIKLILEGTKKGDLNQYLHSVKGFEGISGSYDADGNNAFTLKTALKQFTRNGYLYLSSN